MRPLTAAPPAHRVLDHPLAAARGAGPATALSVLAAPEGLARLADEAPSLSVICAAVDDHLDERGFIVPGLGDAGDRLYGTL